MNLILKSGLLSNSTNYFQVSIRNPKFATTGGGFRLLTMPMYSNNIQEYVEIVNVLSTESFTWGANNANLNIYLGWGVDLAQASLPSEFKIIRGNAALNPRYFYNALKFEFRPSLPTPPGIELQILIRIPAESGFSVLPSSISENLPPISGKTVSCFVNTTVDTAQSIICTGVSALSNISNYHIAFKAFFPFSASEAALGSDFGKITIYSLNKNTGNYDAIALVSEGRCTGCSFLTKNNVGWQTNLAANGYTFVHSQNSGGAISAVTSTTYGVRNLQTLQMLVFVIKAAPADFVGGGFSGTAGFTAYTTSRVVETSTTVLSDGKQMTPFSLQGASLNARANSDLSAGKKWTWLSVWAASSGAFSTGIADGSLNIKTFGVKDYNISFFSSNYVEETTLDFYGATYNQMKTTPALIKNFAFNSYSISQNPLGLTDSTGNFLLAVSHFWTGFFCFLLVS